MIEFSFDKLDSSQVWNFYISSYVSKDHLKRTSIGFALSMGIGNTLFYINRTELILDKFGLEIESLSLVRDLILGFINKMDINDIKINIHFSSQEIKNRFINKINNSHYLTLTLNKLHYDFLFLSRKGINLIFNVDSISKLKEYLKIASRNYILKNDFQEKIQVFSSNVSKTFDEIILRENQLFELIEIISEHCMNKGIPNVHKRILTQLDLGSINSELENVKIIGCKNLNSFSTMKLDTIRRMFISLRESDVGLLWVQPVIDGDYGLLDLWYIGICSYLNIPIFIYDFNRNTWLTRSISNKRDLVESKRSPNILDYKKISYYLNSTLALKAGKNWGQIIKKSIKS